MSTFEAWILGTAIISGLGAIAAVVVAVVALHRQQDVKLEQPVTVQAVENFVHRDEFVRFNAVNEQAHKDIFSKLGGAERGMAASLNELRAEIHAMELRINESGEERSEKIHGRVNDILAEVSELRGELRRR